MRSCLIHHEHMGLPVTGLRRSSQSPTVQLSSQSNLIKNFLSR
ncbi:hypothetical protein LINPERPRIM_LOCUS26455 [Linum perenne]